MNRLSRALVLAILAAGAASATTGFAAEAPAAKPAHYSVSATTVGQLLNDPAAVEILKKLIPTVYANEMFHTMGKDLTLQDIQQYEGEALSKENLDKIQAEFNKIPAKS
jgi:hypothetical protein